MYTSFHENFRISVAAVFENILFLRKAPYFHCFAIISLLKMVLTFILKIKIPSPDDASYKYKFWPSGSREEANNMKTSRQTDGQ